MKIGGWLYRQKFIILITVTFVILVSLTSSVIPLSKAPDEYVHFLYSRFIVENKRLPITVDERQKAGYKSDQPPLYYGLLAATTAWINTDGPPVLKMTWDSSRRQLADIVLPRGMIVWTDDETFPYQGIVLAWFMGRWLSILLSAGTIALVYFIALQLPITNYQYPKGTSLPIINTQQAISNPQSLISNSKFLALAAAATVAFTPAYMFISAVLNDDNLIGVMVALFFLTLVLIAQNRPSKRLFVVLGMLMGLAITTKYSTVILPLEVIAALILIGRYWGWRRAVWLKGIGLCLTTAGIFTLWWFIFVTWHFNEVDKLGWPQGMIKPIIAGDASDPTIAILTGPAEESAVVSQGPFYEWVATFFIRFWETSVFGVAPLYPSIYTGLLMMALCGLALVGLWRIWQNHHHHDRFWLKLLALHLLAFLILPLVRYFISGQIHDTAQARHLLFPAAPAFGILLVWGLSVWFAPNRRLNSWPGFFNQSQHLARYGYFLLPLVLLGLSLAQLYYFNRAFPDRLPVRTAPELVKAPDYPLRESFDDGLVLLGFDRRLLKDRLELVLYWQAQSYSHEDYLTELSLLDNTGQLMAQTVAHPAHGRYPTRAWDPGDTIYDTIVLPLANIPAGEYQVQLRLLGWEAPLKTQVDGIESIYLTELKLPTTVTAAPPRYDLPGQYLTGFTLWQAGRIAENWPTYRYLAEIPVTLPTLPAEYTARLQLVGPDDIPREPTNGNGSLYTFIVGHNWPSGAYRLEAAVWQDDTLVERVQSQQVLYVQNREIPFEPPPIRYPLQANFEDKILLLGYDLLSRRITPAEGVPIQLYWQALSRMRHSYVMFARLIDNKQQVWGAYDRLPREIYSTILWVPGEVVHDGFILPIDPATPDGIYTVVLGLYRQDDPEAKSLSLLHQGQPSGDTSVTLGPVKIGQAPPGATITELSPQVKRNDQFGSPPIISLQGYDLETASDALTLKLYWRSENETDSSYTRFIHLRDAQEQLVAQSDAPPGGVYPTALWDAGQVIADETTLSLSSDLPPANYTLVTGLYDPTTGQRLLLSDGADSIYLTTVEIK